MLVWTYRKKPQNSREIRKKIWYWGWCILWSQLLWKSKQQNWIKLFWDPTSWTETATDCVASALLDPYEINPIASGTIRTGNTLSNFGDGLTFTLRELVDNPPAGTPLDTRTLALSVADFNVFRKRVAIAIDALDDKITQILNVPRPGCWAAWNQYHQDYLIHTMRNLPTPT